MTSLLLVLLLACPLVMTFMMRGTHSGGDRTCSSHGPEVDHHQSYPSDGPLTGPRIEQLDREMAAVR